MAETTALQAKMKFDTAEVTQARTLKKGYKVTGISGSGTVKLNKVTSYWLKRAAQAEQVVLIRNAHGYGLREDNLPLLQIGPRPLRHLQAGELIVL